MIHPDEQRQRALRLLLGALAGVLGISAAQAIGEARINSGSKPAWAGVERVGPPNLNFIDVERYRFGSTDMSNPQFYPVPQAKITRDSYMRAIDAANPRALASRPDQGERGPVVFLPVLAKYVQTRDPSWGKAIIAMLKHYHLSLQKIVARRKWFWDFEWPVTAIPLYRKHLIAGGLLTADDTWFRDMWLYYCRHLHVWDSEETEWRGGCHRSMPEGLSKGLAARWYPDIPEAAHWKHYGELNFRDFWRSKEVPQNDTGYMIGPIVALICNSDQVFTQVYYPHAPYRARASTNNPGAVAVYSDRLQATAGAAGVTVLRDDVDVSVLRLEFDQGRVEHVIFNPKQASVALDSVTTQRPYAYIDTQR